MPNSSAICISGRPLDCNSAMASRLNSSVKLRRGFVIKHPSCPFPERSKGVHQFGGGSHTALKVGEIFRGHGPAWRKANAGQLSLGQLKVMSAVEQGRTAALGGHVARCERCD